jgi:cystathionine beta-synthase
VESDLLDALVQGRVKPDDELGAHMSAPLPTMGSGEPVTKAVEVLEKSGAAVVLVDGKPAGLITRLDLLTFLASA